MDANRKHTNTFAALDRALVYSGTQRPLYQGSLTQQRMVAMDAHARACPASVTRTIPDLATYLRSAAKSPEERVRAICFWLHLNVRYDIEALLSGNIRSMNAVDVLQARSSVCHGFARLMAELCKACDVECELVRGCAKGLGYDKGASRPDGPRYESNHVWAAVQLYCPSQWAYCWFLVDPTWCSGHYDGSGYVREWHPQYFFADPATFVQSHFPEDAKWTLLPEEQRPTWQAFSSAVRIEFPMGWDLGIMPLTHPHMAVTVPEEGRVHMVFRARKEAQMYGVVSGGGNRSDSVYPTSLPDPDDTGSVLLAYDFKNLRPSRMASSAVTLTFYANRRNSYSYTGTLTYVLKPSS